MQKSFFNTKNIALTGIIAALYAGITLVFAPISFGPMQVRISEALTLLPVLFPQSILGLTIGCFFSNLLGSPTPWDVVFGTISTFIAAISTYKLRNYSILISALPPVFFNTLIIGSIIYFTGFSNNISLALIFVSIGIGQTLAVYLLGIPFIKFLKKLSFLKDIDE